MSDAESQADPAQRATASDPEVTVLPDPGLGAAPAAPPSLTGEAPEEPTVGTGSVFAIGCVAGTLLFIVIAIVVAIWLR